MKFYSKIDEIDTKYDYVSKDIVAEVKELLLRTINMYVPYRNNFTNTEETFSTCDCCQRIEFDRIYNRNDPEWQKKRKPDDEVLNTVYYEYGEGADKLELTLSDVYDLFLFVTEEDEISFSYFRYCILEEVSNANGYPTPPKDFPPSNVISYSIKYDIEETQKEANGIPDIRKRLEYLENKLTKSRLEVAVANDERGCEIKSIFEEQIRVLIEVTDVKLKEQRNLSSTAKPKMQMEESVGRLESLENGEPDKYLTYYDFNNCPIELRAEPFSINLLDYRIVKTERGLDDTNAVLADIFKNLYKSLVYVNTDDAKVIYDEARNLLQSLYGQFLRNCSLYYKKDVDTVVQLSKWWSMNTSKIIGATIAEADIPDTQSYERLWGKETRHSAVTKNLLHFKRTMIENCIYLTILGMCKLPGCLTSDLQIIVPFNYYGKDFTKKFQEATEKRIRNEEDKSVTDYLKNCSQLGPYLLEKIGEFKGLVSNDIATSKKKHEIANSFINMANDYLTRVEQSGVSDNHRMKFLFNLWHWILSESTRNILSFLTSMNLCIIGHLEYSSEEEGNEIDESTKCYTSAVTVLMQAIAGMIKDFENSFLSSGDGVHEDITPKNEQDATGKYEPILFVATVDYPKLMTEVDKKCFKNISLDDFEKAIRTGDISLLKSQAEIMGYQSGALGALKWFVKILSTALGSQWYKKAAESIGLDTKKLDKVNKTTDAAKSLDYDKIMKCIKL